MSESETMTSEELRRWAVIAAKAVGIPAADVAMVENSEKGGLPAVEIGATVVQLVEATLHTVMRAPEVVTYWATGDETYDSLSEALCVAVSEEAFKRAASALRDAGLSDDA